MVSHWILSESKSPPVSRILLSILAKLDNVVVRRVSFYNFLIFQFLYQVFGDYYKWTDYVEISEKSVRLIHQDGFLIVQI